MAQAELAGRLGGPAAEAGRAREAAEAVLARPEFQPAEPSLLDRGIQWLLERLGRLFLGIDIGATGAVGAVVLVALLALLVLAVLWLLRSVRHSRPLESAVSGDVGRRSVDWAGESAAHEAAGRWRDAVRCRYREILADLAALGTVQERPGRTAGEHLRDVAERLPGARAAFAGVTSTFEAVWYGGDEPDATTLAALNSDVAAVRAAAGLRAPRPAADDRTTALAGAR